MYLPSIRFERTKLEKTDPFLSWNRDDQAFFAAGACHILAYLFVQLHPNENYQLIHIKPVKDYSGNHMYVTNGTWAFDHNGWTLENELLTITKDTFSKKYKGWDYERIIIEDDLESFCKKYYHRPPSHFAYLPWERAYNYIKKFDPIPPIR